MLIASHQPYFFPYIGYFSLISAVDKFIFFDISQFTRRSWMSRNRILKPDRNHDQYINIALKKPGFAIKLPGCEINDQINWKSKILAQLKHYKHIAPFYFEIISFLEEIFHEDNILLNDFNIRSLKRIMEFLNIDTPTLVFSKLKPENIEIDNLWDWALLMCRLLNADSYLNAPGGESIYPVEVFKENNIKLGFIQNRLREYNQKNQRFIHSLSIIDVLMFNGRKETIKMINEFRIKWV